MACHDVCKVAQRLRGVSLGPDVNVNSAAAGSVALGSGSAQAADELLQGVHVGVGEDRGDHLALLAVRPRDAAVPLEFPLAAVRVPRAPRAVAVAYRCVLVSARPEEPDKV